MFAEQLVSGENGGRVTLVLTDQSAEVDDADLSGFPADGGGGGATRGRFADELLEFDRLEKIG